MKKIKERSKQNGLSGKIGCLLAVWVLLLTVRGTAQMGTTLTPQVLATAQIQTQHHQIASPTAPIKEASEGGVTGAFKSTRFLAICTAGAPILARMVPK